MFLLNFYRGTVPFYDSKKKKKRISNLFIIFIWNDLFITFLTMLK